MSKSTVQLKVDPDKSIIKVSQEMRLTIENLYI